MDRSTEGGILFETAAPLVKGLGFTIVELVGTQRKQTFHVNLVIHAEDGVDLAACTAVYKAVYPRLEVALGAPEVHLEVSSPGVYRKIKDAKEFEIFSGMKVKLITDSEPEWVVGIITETTEDTLELNTDDGLKSIRYPEIRKAQLEYP